MHRAKLHISTVLLSLVMAVMVSFASAMCLVEAFGLDCDPVRLLAAGCAAAVAASCAMIPRRTWLVTLAAAVVYLAVLIWQRLPLEESFQGFLYRVTSEYALCYEGVSIAGHEADCLPLMAALTVPMAWVTARVVCREGNVLLLLLACMPVLILCLVIVDVAPVFWLIVLTFALLLLLLTHSVREHSSNEGSRLSWWMILPTTILVAGITVLWPPADYTRADWSEALQVAAEQQIPMETIRQEVFSDLPKWSREMKEIDLGDLDPKSMTGREVLESKAPEGAYYLRAVSLGIYEDNRWQAIPQSDYIAQQFDGVPAVQGGGVTATLEMRTKRLEEALYTTYFVDSLPDSAQYVDDAYVKNQDRLSEYTVKYFTVAAGWGEIPEGYAEFVQRYYTQIPEDLKQELTTILVENGWNVISSPSEMADFVRESAEYDLNTPKLPEGEDFVLYFLRESKRGYCVHFATATVMLLRTMGIPARYVTGYSVKGAPGEWVTVTEDDAHAWVEYWVSGLGWMPLDPTPVVRASEQEPETPETQPDAPEEETPPPAEPEQPDEPQLPPQEQEQGKLPLPGAKADGEGSGGSGSYVYLWLLALPGLLLLLWLRRWLILRRRNDRCQRGHPNRRALAMWSWLVRLAQADGEPPEEELLCLAEKARFSQHTLTEEELSRLQEALDQRIAGRKACSVVKQLWYRYGLVLY